MKKHVLILTSFGQGHSDAHGDEHKNVGKHGYSEEGRRHLALHTNAGENPLDSQHYIQYR